MRGRIIGLAALLWAGASQAQRVSEPYAKVGYWEITTENHRECAMKRVYPGKTADDEEGLIIGYDAQAKAAVLGWAPRKPKFPALTESLDLQLAFLNGSKRNESWESQPFRIAKSGDTYSLIHLFKGPGESDQFLRDLASHDTFALFLGQALMTGLPLNASDAVAKLRECSSKIVEQRELPSAGE
jgi:hypothetical protein